MKPLKRTVINFIIFFITYVGVTYAMKHFIEGKTLVILSVFYFIINYVIYTILDKVSKD